VIVAIDGPAGAGKSSVARAVADALGFPYLNSGAMYRAVGLLTLREGGAASEHAERLRIEVGDRVLLDGEDVTEALRTPEVTEAASRVATNERVREALALKQRELVADGDWVVEGRDIGTVVAPDAAVKVFLTASADARAQRRTAERIDPSATVQATLEDLDRRDRFDSTRAASPLAQAPDAVVVDATDLTLDQVVDAVVDLVRSRLAVTGTPHGGRRS
jgi:CMP/dCMP kinase